MGCWSTLVKTANPFCCCCWSYPTWFVQGRSNHEAEVQETNTYYCFVCPKILFKHFNMPFYDFWCIRGNQTYHCAVWNTLLVIFSTIYEILKLELRLFFVECLPEGCSMEPVVALDHLCNCWKNHTSFVSLHWLMFGASRRRKLCCAIDYQKLCLLNKP